MSTYTHADLANIRKVIDQLYADIVQRPAHSDPDAAGVMVIVVTVPEGSDLSDMGEGVETFTQYGTLIGARGMMLTNTIRKLEH